MEIGGSEVKTIQKELGRELAKRALELEAIKLSPNEPFKWASGYWMPIYNDNRRLLVDWEVRSLIAQGFKAIIEELNLVVDNVAGTATAGIPHATTLADLLKKPLSYVRSAGKGHGLRNLIEGLPPHGSYQGGQVILIEDLISTGGSSIKALEAIRECEGEVSTCLAIFTYGLEASLTAFAALEPPCKLVTLFDYDLLIATAEAIGYVNQEERKVLEEWREDPFGWGDKHGFMSDTRG
jgi:orotate phosphoribosyltransferase